MRYLQAVLIAVAAALLFSCGTSFQSPHSDGRFSLFASAAPVTDGPFRWMLTQRLRDDVNGQPFLNYSDSFHSLGNTLAIGSTSYNMGRGQVTIMFDAGDGMQIQAVLKDPAGIVGDGYGARVHLFRARTLLHIAVTALYKSGDGAVFLYRQKYNNKGLWELQETYFPPDETYVNDYGRTLHYDGINFLINAERRYVSGPRFQVSAINWKGTSYWQQTDGVSPMAGDPVFVYRLEEQRANGTHFILAQTLTEAPYTLDYGVTMEASGDVLAVGGSFREALHYGHGTDGDLVVTGVYLLDGTAEYNFNSVTVRSGGTLTVGRYEEESMSGGRLLMRVKETLTVEAGGAINLTAYGFPGGATSFSDGQQPEKGFGPGGGHPATSTYTGPYSCDYDGSVSGNVPSIGGAETGSVGRPVNSSVPFAEACGGGGSYGTVGESGTDVHCGTSGQPGVTYGDPLLNETFLGSGGGSGFPWQVGSGGRGGNGGGSITIYAKRIINHGAIEANGGDGADGGFFSGGGGGGSGGSIAMYGGNFANYGRVTAMGGRGGQRAIGSGFGEDWDAKGGDGGHGRIMFDFLTTQSHGTVVPYPRNLTTYSGDVLVYRRDPSDPTGKWEFFSHLPRLSGMMFIGHQLALEGHRLAVGSDQGTPVDPTQRVYIFNIAYLQNDTSVLPYRVLSPPSAADEKFGWKLQFSNASLVVGAEGSPNTRGAAYVYQSTDLLTHTDLLTPMRLTNGAPGDYFANVISFNFPFLFVQEPFSQDDQPDPNNSRRSIGNIHFYKWVRNVTGTASHVMCEFSTITVDNVVNCSVHLFSDDGEPTGDINEIARMSPAVDFQGIGHYSFQRSFAAAGSYTITIDYDGTPLAPFAMEVTPAVVPVLSNFSCFPNPAVNGELVTCRIETNPGTGEAIAAREFDVQTYRLEDAQITVNGTRVYTPFGQQFINLPSFYLVNQPLRDDYPTQAPAVSYVKQGVFEFAFRPWLPGYFASYVMYKREALRFPNPSIIEATPAPVDPPNSRLACPANVAPGRTYTCTVEMRGYTGFRTGDPSWAAQFVNQSVVSATVVSASADASATVGTVFSPLFSWWAGEGRAVVVFNISTTGSVVLEYSASANGLALPTSGETTVKFVYPQVCGRFPELEVYINLFEANMYYDIDTFRYGEWVEARAFRGRDSSWCDEPRI